MTDTSTPVTLIDQFKALLAQGLLQSDALKALHEHGDKYPDYAAQVETDDDLEIDMGAELYSAGVDGVWVQCWVHVPHPESAEEP